MQRIKDDLIQRDDRDQPHQLFKSFELRVYPARYPDASGSVTSNVTACTQLHNRVHQSSQAGEDQRLDLR